jgi:tRNA splicing ligase
VAGLEEVVDVITFITGKTTLARGLVSLFGFAHTQSDDVRSQKNAARIFLGNVENLLRTEKVVIADKYAHVHFEGPYGHHLKFEQE